MSNRTNSVEDRIMCKDEDGARVMKSSATPDYVDDEYWSIEDHGYKTPCRVWKRSRRNEYGQRWVGTHGIKEGPHRYRLVSTHRWEYEQVHGPIPPKLLVLHWCDVKLCGNVEHLHLGNHSINALEAVARGLLVPQRGEDHHDARLTLVQVQEIRSADERPVDLAKRFGVSAQHITQIRKGQKWKCAA
jgi:hypothetical protein